MPNDKQSSKPAIITMFAPSFPGTTPAPASVPTSPALAFEPFPRFPSVDDLLRHQSGAQAHPLVRLSDTQPPPQTSLFRGLLGGRADVILQDALVNPERYDQDTLESLRALIGKAQFSEEDEQLLSRALIDFEHGRRPKQPPRPAPTRAPARKKIDFSPMADGREPMADVPGAVQDAYWWLR